MLNVQKLVFLIAALAAVVLLGVTNTIDDTTTWLALIFGAALPASPIERKPSAPAGASS